MTVDPQLLDPFWRSATMRAESLFFVDAGNGAATASLLFDCAEELSLTSATGGRSLRIGFIGNRPISATTHLPAFGAI